MPPPGLDWGGAGRIGQQEVVMAFCRGIGVFAATWHTRLVPALARITPHGHTHRGEIDREKYALLDQLS